MGELDRRRQKVLVSHWTAVATEVGNTLHQAAIGELEGDLQSTVDAIDRALTSLRGQKARVLRARNESRG